MSKEAFSFVVYMIHACANKWGSSPARVYSSMRKANCIDGFLVPHYEILHTQGTDYVVEDIREYLANRKVAV